MSRSERREIFNGTRSSVGTWHSAGRGKGSMTTLLDWVGGGIIAPNGVGGQRISGQQREREGTKRLAARNSPRASEERTDGQKDASNFASPLTMTLLMIEKHRPGPGYRIHAIAMFAGGA